MRSLKEFFSKIFPRNVKPIETRIRMSVYTRQIRVNSDHNVLIREIVIVVRNKTNLDSDD